MPEQWPSYFQKAKGIEISDLDGNRFLDFSIMSVGSCLLGYNDVDVNQAVKQVIDQGTISTLNPPEEVELAKVLIGLHPWAQMARFARTGGEAMAIAVRIARAKTGRDKIAFCGYHGWHDWYLSANLADDKNLDGHLLPGLEPRGLKGTMLPFHYNKIEELERIVEENKDLAAIIIEPIRHQEPAQGFLERVREITNQAGSVLIVDEISAGFRFCLGGAHLKYGLKPDIAVFAKAMSNGFPMAVVIGKGKIMEAAQDTFVSSSYWTERIGPTAALATIKKLERENAPAHLEKMGGLIEKGWQKLAEKHSLDIEIKGPPAWISFSFKDTEQNQVLQCLFTQEMLARGYLASRSVYLSLAHQPEQIEQYLKAVNDVFGIIKQAIIQNKVKQMLKGPISHQGFTRLT